MSENTIKTVASFLTSTGKLKANVLKAFLAQGTAFVGLIEATQTVAERNESLCKLGVDSGLNFRIALMVQGLWPVVDGKPQKMPDFKAQADTAELLATFARVNKFASWCSSNKLVTCKQEGCEEQIKAMHAKDGLCPTCFSAKKLAELTAQQEEQKNGKEETAETSEEVGAVIVKKSVANMIKALIASTFELDLSETDTEDVTIAFQALCTVHGLDYSDLSDSLEGAELTSEEDSDTANV